MKITTIIRYFMSFLCAFLCLSTPTLTIESTSSIGDSIEDQTVYLDFITDSTQSIEEVHQITSNLYDIIEPCLPDETIQQSRIYTQ